MKNIKIKKGKVKDGKIEDSEVEAEENETKERSIYVEIYDYMLEITPIFLVNVTKFRLLSGR